MFQSGAPVFLPSLDSVDRPIRLETSRDASGKAHNHDEAFLRDLIHRCPEILPISEIEPIFDNARAICIELPNPAGFADNLLVTPEGGIVLVECKLQRNLQARREVIAQIMDYAARLQALTFEDLDAAVRRAELPGKGKPTGLVESFEDADDFDPISFMDAVTRNLRRGRMLLLVVGDGIREGLESLAEIVQRHPGFHAALGLVELKLYPLPSGGYVIQPRTLLRTLNIERGVVTFTDDRFTIAPPAIQPRSASESTATRRPASLTEEEFYSILGSKLPHAPEFVRKLVPRLEELGLSPEFKRSLIMRWNGSDGRSHNVINIRKSGMVMVDPISWQMKTETERAIAAAYKNRIAAAVGGELRTTANEQNVCIGGRILTVEELRHHEDACVEAVKLLLQEFQEQERSR
jgi:hypothetical protein